MLRVGLTGGVGSGKSAVAAMLRACGAHVSCSDEIGRALMQPGEEVFARIVQHFGTGVLTSEGELDRAMLARLAFDEGRAEELNGIVHPAVIAAQSRWMSAVAEVDVEAVAVVESALIFETKWNGDGSSMPWRTRFDRIVAVTAPVEVRRARYVERLSGSMAEDAAAGDFTRRSAAQWNDAQRSALADVVIANAGTLQDLCSAVERLYAVLRQESLDRAAEAI